MVSVSPSFLSRYANSRDSPAVTTRASYETKRARSQSTRSESLPRGRLTRRHTRCTVGPARDSTSIVGPASPRRLDRMNVVTALAIAAGVLVAVWVKVSVLINLPFWYVSVFGWASYIGAGGGMN